jgi:hypothetical protein
MLVRAGLATNQEAMQDTGFALTDKLGPKTRQRERAHKLAPAAGNPRFIPVDEVQPHQFADRLQFLTGTFPNIRAPGFLADPRLHRQHARANTSIEIRRAG